MFSYTRPHKHHATHACTCALCAASPAGELNHPHASPPAAAAILLPQTSHRELQPTRCEFHSETMGKMSSPGFQRKIRDGAKKFEFQAEVGLKTDIACPKQQQQKRAVALYHVSAQLSLDVSCVE